jgi:uncharacterized protein (DUF2147 family)
MRLVRLLSSLALLAATAMPALASPNGIWELDTKDTRFELELCGNGTQLCGQLVWLSDADYNEQYKPYLNKPIAVNLRPSGANRWKGNLKLFGYNLSGTITQHSEDHMSLQGCAVLIICKNHEMYRHAE